MKMMALNAYESDAGCERLLKCWLWTPLKMVDLNTYENGGILAFNAYENGSSERLWKSWLWMSMKMMALNAYENDGGFERLWNNGLEYI